MKKSVFGKFESKKLNNNASKAIKGGYSTDGPMPQTRPTTGK